MHFGVWGFRVKATGRRLNASFCEHCRHSSTSEVPKALSENPSSSRAPRVAVSQRETVLPDGARLL